MPLTSLSYGAVELKRYAHAYWLTGLALAVMLHCSVLGLYYAFGLHEATPGWTLPPPHQWPGFIPAPSSPPLPGIVEPRHPGRVSAPGDAASPVPVSDDRADPGKTMATQDELRTLVDPPGASAGDGVGEGPIVIPPSEEEAPPEWVQTEELPHVVKRVVPAYPELALRAGLTGRVFVKVWVDKEGKPRKAIATGEGNEIFHQAAVDAAMQFVFTPAIMNGRPVSVWISIAFSFKLQ